MLTVKNITKFFKGRPVLQDVSFSAQAGELLCILGPNGSGKTTLFKTLSALLLPEEGRINVLGRGLLQNSAAVKPLIGMSFSEERGFYGRLTGAQNLRFFASLYALSTDTFRERLSGLSNLLKMDEFLNVPYLQMSSGMKQRLSLARSLLHDPKILLLDEPGKSLDVSFQIAFTAWIAEKFLRQPEKLVLWATNRLEEVSELKGRVLILKGGKLLVDKPFGALCSDGRSPREVYLECLKSPLLS